MSKKIKITPPVLLDWVAQTVSDAEIKQFPVDGPETNFRSVIDLSNDRELSFLWLIPSKLEYRKSIIFGVDFMSGEHIINGIRLNLVPKEIQHIPDLHFRPIFFRRMRMDFNEQGEVPNSGRIHRYLLGWQTTVNNENHQRFISIDPMTASVAEIQKKR